MSKDYEYESELTAGREEIAAVLDDLLDGINAGSIRLSDGTEAVTVTAPDELDLEIELEVEDDEVSLELELTWPVPDGEGPAFTLGEDPPEEGDGLAVSTGDTDQLESLARFEVFRDRGDEWRWRLRHRNGNIIATSGQGYTQKHNAWKGLRSVVRNAPEAELTEDSMD